MTTNISPSPVHVFFKKIGKFFLHKATLSTIILLCVVGFVSYKMLVSSQVKQESVIAKVGELKQYVEVTGSIQASRDANLSFQTIGVVSRVGVKVGDVVSQGRVLASLQSGDQEAALLQAKAQLGSAEATLEQLTQGSRKEEVAIKQQSVDSAKNSLDQTYASLPDVIRNVDTTTADVLKNKLSVLFSNNGELYTISFSSCDQSLQSSIETSRSKIEKTLTDFQKKSSSISSQSSQEEVDVVFEQAYSTAIVTNTLVSDISRLLFSSCSTQNTALDTQRTIVSLARTTVNALFTEITAKRNALSSAKNILAQATKDLELTKAGTDPYRIKSQIAVVAQAEAQVVQAEEGLRKTSIKAPFSGTISDVSITEGETVSGGKTVIGMLAVDSFEIEAKVPEVDIVKVKVGALVDVTLDAYGKGVVFPATVTRVNPTAIVEGSVPMYKVIITFVGADDRIKSGMTANVKIVTENKMNVIVLPARFVEVIDSARGTVLVLNNQVTTKKDVILGIRGQDGLIEVVSGLASGDEVLAPSTGARSAQKQTK